MCEYKPFNYGFDNVSVNPRPVWESFYNLGYISHQEKKKKCVKTICFLNKTIGFGFTIKHNFGITKKKIFPW